MIYRREHFNAFSLKYFLLQRPFSALFHFRYAFYLSYITSIMYPAKRYIQWHNTVTNIECIQVSLIHSQDFLWMVVKRLRGSQQRDTYTCCLRHEHFPIRYRNQLTRHRADSTIMNEFTAGEIRLDHARETRKEEPLRGWNILFSFRYRRAKLIVPSNRTWHSSFIFTERSFSWLNIEYQIFFSRSSSELRW